MPQTSPLLISTHSPGFQVFASPSAVTSATHIPALKCVRKGASLFSGFAQAGRSPDKCNVKKRSGRGSVQAKENYFSVGRNNREYYEKWKNRIAQVKIPKLPFSNFLVIQKLMDRIPENSLVHLTILNSIRLTQFSNVKNKIRCYANLGADGIDGSLSTFLGQASDEEDTLKFFISGDLSFLYDVNGMQISLNKSCRFLVINNFAGAEFHKNFDTKAIPMIDDYIAAGHETKIEDFVLDLDVKYISASNETELLSGIDIFCSMSEQPIVFEVFTDAEIDAKILLQFYAENRSRSKIITIRKMKQKMQRILERLKIITR